MRRAAVTLALLGALALSAPAGSASPSPISSALFVTFARGGHATPPATHGISTAALSDCRDAS